MAWGETALAIVSLTLGLLVLHEKVSPIQSLCSLEKHEGECNHECGNSGVKLRSYYLSHWCTGEPMQHSTTVPCNRFCYNNGAPMDGFCNCHTPYSGKCCSECKAKNCLFSEWGSWSECVPDCGGYRTRRRNVIREAQCGGSPCSDKITEELKCEQICLNGGNLLAGQCQCVMPYSGDCCESCHAVDCKWSEWNEWTICEPSCGGSRQRTRVREELNPAVCGGGACVGSNTEYKDCESICYNGQVSAEGHCVCQDDYTGLCCEVCMPLNCSWGSWNEWSTCEPACGNNRHRTRQRILEGQSRCGGTCSGLPEESETCDTVCQNDGSPMDGYCSCTSPFSGNCCENCARVDCKWSSWGYWSACNPECGAVRNRTRTMLIAQNSQCGGTKCGPQPSEISLCPPICSHGGTADGNVCNCIPSYTGDCCEICVAIDCVWSDWSAWSNCEPECGPKRIQTRTRTILTPEWCGGLGCPGETTQNQTCSPVCFNGGTPTNDTCGCLPWFRGECCGSCQPSDCKWEEWQEWTSCHPLCGMNRQKTRIRTILAHATCDGLCPGSSKDSMSCNDTCENNGTPMNGYCLCQEPYSGQCCEKCIPTDCELTPWNQWSGCSPNCGVNRTRTRTRSVDREAECGGLECEASLFEQESCLSLCYHGGVAEDDGCQCHTPYTGDCCESCEAVDCKWTEWSSWGSCLPVCGNNRLQSRKRFLKKPSDCRGKCLGNNISTRPCESVCFNGGKPISESSCQCPTPYTGACCETCISVNCTWGPWGDWSSCQPKCGNNRQRQRKRIMERHPVCGGTCTGSPTEIEDCESLCYNKGTPMHGYCLCLFPFSPISCCKSTNGDPCIYHSVLNNPWRSVGNSEIINSSCDTGFNSDTWYRFRGAGGDQMSEKCTTVNTCGVKFPIWLNGKHPTTPGQNVERQACASASKDGVTKCCEYKTIVTIRKCSDFFVYQFHATRTCEEGYCIGEESPCPSGTTSLNGYTPKCFAPPPKIDKQPQLYLEETYSGFYLLCVFEYPDHQNVSFDVIWSSEKDELHQETLFESRNATLPGEMIDVNHLLIYCKITAMFIYPDGTVKSTPSSAVSSRSILLSVEELQSPASEPTAASIFSNSNSDISNNRSLPIGVSIGVVVLLLLFAVTLCFVIFREKRIRAPSSKLFFLNKNRGGSSENIYSESEEDNCNTML